MPKRSRIPENFDVTPRIVELARVNRWPDPRTELDAFRDYHLAHGSTMADWEAAFRTWLRNAAKWGKPSAPRTPEPKPIRKAADRPRDDARYDPRVSGMVQDLVSKLAGGNK